MNKRSEASRLKSYTNRIMTAPVFQNDTPSPRKMRAAKRNQVRGLPMIRKRDENYEQAMKERLDLLGLVARKKKARKPAKGQKEKNITALPQDDGVIAGET